MSDGIDDDAAPPAPDRFERMFSPEVLGLYRAMAQHHGAMHDVSSEPVTFQRLTIEHDPPDVSPAAAAMLAAFSRDYRLKFIERPRAPAPAAGPVAASMPAAAAQPSPAAAAHTSAAATAQPSSIAEKSAADDKAAADAKGACKAEHAVASKPSPKSVAGKTADDLEEGTGRATDEKAPLSIGAAAAPVKWVVDFVHPPPPPTPRRRRNASSAPASSPAVSAAQAAGAAASAVAGNDIGGDGDAASDADGKAGVSADDLDDADDYAEPTEGGCAVYAVLRPALPPGARFIAKINGGCCRVNSPVEQIRVPAWFEYFNHNMTTRTVEFQLELNESCHAVRVLSLRNWSK